MNGPIRFLHSLAQALSTLQLYAPGHPAADRAAGTLWDGLEALLAEHESVTFFFLGAAPVYEGRALHELADWAWSSRLSEAGVRRVEFTREATRQALLDFLQEIQRRFNSPAPIESYPDEMGYPGVRFGKVTVVDPFAEGGDEEPDEETEGSRELPLDLSDELEAVRFVLDESRADRLARAEADAVIRILGAHLDRHELPQAAPPADHDAYPQVHAVNTALLAMAVGTAAGLDVNGRHRLGLAVLLHDIGMALLPPELLHVEAYTPAQRQVMESHTVEGAKLLLRNGGRAMALGAAVAFEHHLRPDGGGYPRRRFRPAPHWASRLTGACSAYVSLRVARPYRAAWPAARALGYLDEAAGSVLDPEVAKAVASMVRLAR